jgi:hypothetical protein
MGDFASVNRKVREYVVGRHTNFWCGFCRGVIENQIPGGDPTRNRFDHFSHHFIKEGKVMANWMPIDQRGPIHIELPSSRVGSTHERPLCF